MIPQRYDCPTATLQFSEETKIHRWKMITRDYAVILIRKDVHLEQRLVAAKEFDDIVAKMQITPEMIVAREAYTGHDVVAFLSLFLNQLPEKFYKYIHFGMTSSDLVENAQSQAMNTHRAAMGPHIDSLVALIKDNIGSVEGPRVGRTHGQFADLSSFEHFAEVHSHVLRRIRTGHFFQRKGAFKSMGPTGDSPWDDGRSAAVADGMNAFVVPSTQVIPRDYMLEWATGYLRLACALENFALQIRLAARAEIGEIREKPRQAGSSAMPHKNNPISAEKVCGLARVARGHFLALSEGTALWEDRDLTNSAPERIAVSGLASVVEHMLLTTINMVSGIEVDQVRVANNVSDPVVVRSHTMQVLAQDIFGIGPIEASHLVKATLSGSKGGLDAVEGLGLSPGDLMEWRDRCAAEWYNRSTADWKKRNKG